MLFTVTVVCGKLVAPFYLEATIIYFLQTNNGNFSIKAIEEYFKDVKLTAEILERLKNRKNILIKKDIVILNGQNISKGFRNSIMRWALKGVSFRDKKRQR